jgi:hypothetical protein
MAQSGIPLGEYSGSKATNALHNTIKEYNEQTSEQTKTMIRLSWAMTGLAVASLVASGVQIWLALR